MILMPENALPRALDVVVVHHANRWHKVAPMHTRRLGVAVAVLNGCLYAVGGSDGRR